MGGGEGEITIGCGGVCIIWYKSLNEVKLRKIVPSDPWS